MEAKQQEEGLEEADAGSPVAESATRQRTPSPLRPLLGRGGRGRRQGRRRCLSLPLAFPAPFVVGLWTFSYEPLFWHLRLGLQWIHVHTSVWRPLVAIAHFQRSVLPLRCSLGNLPLRCLGRLRSSGLLGHNFRNMLPCSAFLARFDSGYVYVHASLPVVSGPLFHVPFVSGSHLFGVCFA